MEQKEIITVDGNTKVLVPAVSFDFESDRRLLIPFTCCENIGFVNCKKEIVLEPKYAIYCGECYNTDDTIIVAVIDVYGFPRHKDEVATYKRLHYGLVNYKGEVILEPIYNRIIPAIGNKNIFTVQKNNLEYGVLNIDGTKIIPFGVFNWIDGFDKGLARVKESSGMGIINLSGKIVLPCKYGNVWNFYNKDRSSTRIEKDGISTQFELEYED